MLDAVGSREHGMMGSVGAGRTRCFQVSGTVILISLSLRGVLQRPFELVPREVLSDGQL